MKKSAKAKQTRSPKSQDAELSPSQLIDARIEELGDWRGDLLARLRKLVKQADPEVAEEWKWRGVPVWSHAGILCTGETYKGVVKMTFAKGASLEDPAGLFNSSLDGNTRRAIDFHEGEKINEKALKTLIRSAVAFNTAQLEQRGAKRASSSKTTAKASSTVKFARKKAKRAPAKTANSKPVLLSGGNPQIAKADGDAPVQAYIQAMPDWKSNVGRQLDALIVNTLPDVSKAVKWNSPFYGVAGQGWFLSMHCFAKYIKVAFFQGASLRPVPPVDSKDPNTRYFHIHEDDALDEQQFASWVKQASALPGWTP